MLTGVHEISFRVNQTMERMCKVFSFLPIYRFNVVADISIGSGAMWTQAHDFSMNILLE